MEKVSISTTAHRALEVPKVATNQMYHRPRQEKKAYGGTLCHGEGKNSLRCWSPLNCAICCYSLPMWSHARVIAIHPFVHFLSPRTDARNVRDSFLDTATTGWDIPSEAEPRTRLQFAGRWRGTSFGWEWWRTLGSSD
jgi:hypothetical protein